MDPALLANWCFRAQLRNQEPGNAIAPPPFAIAPISLFSPAQASLPRSPACHRLSTRQETGFLRLNYLQETIIN
ncbi:MAG: hypothetical protein EBE86_006515 [Hormoscilla sp. GUM202]|nr:hypothetical protein [Hormoscilla sp. GUM202]